MKKDKERVEKEGRGWAGEGREGREGRRMRADWKRRVGKERTWSGRKENATGREGEERQREGRKGRTGVGCRRKERT